MRRKKKLHLILTIWATYFLLGIAEPAQPKKDAVLRTLMDRGRTLPLPPGNFQGPIPISETLGEPLQTREPPANTEGQGTLLAQPLQLLIKGFQAGLVRTSEVARAVARWASFRSIGGLSGTLRSALRKGNRTGIQSSRTAALQHTAAGLPRELVEHLQRELSHRPYGEHTSTGRCSGRQTTSTKGSTSCTAAGSTAAASSSPPGTGGFAKTRGVEQEGPASGLRVDPAPQHGPPDSRTVPRGPSSHIFLRGLQERYGKLPPT